MRVWISAKTGINAVLVGEGPPIARVIIRNTAIDGDELGDKSIALDILAGLLRGPMVMVRSVSVMGVAPVWPRQWHRTPQAKAHIG
jgi:hypothetical protein